MRVELCGVLVDEHGCAQHLPTDGHGLAVGCWAPAGYNADAL